jgi:hypothetical protein
VAASSVVGGTFVDVDTGAVDLGESVVASADEALSVDKAQLLATTVVGVAWIRSASFAIKVETVSFVASAGV